MSDTITIVLPDWFIAGIGAVSSDALLMESADELQMESAVELDTEG